MPDKPAPGFYSLSRVSSAPALPPDSAQLVRLFWSPGHNFVGHHGRPPGNHPMLDATEVRCVAGHGIEGDRYFRPDPTAKGQITFFAEEVHDRLRRRFPAANGSPAVYRRNVITRGLDLNALIGVEFQVQGVRFFGTEESRPCDWMNLACGPGARAELAGHGGLRARILSDGWLRLGPVHAAPR